jgi:phosphatidylglycerol:prolipoprotein diacylglycerol transferase
MFGAVAGGWLAQEFSWRIAFIIVGIPGIILAILLHARKAGFSPFAMGDLIACAGPIGLFFGRIANFINGELYGRVAPGVSWAMKFPMALRENKIEAENFGEAANTVSKVVPGLLEYPDGRFKENDEIFSGILQATRSSPEARAALEPYLEPRHPSQLYEAALEGLLLFAILWIVRIKFPKAPNGLLTGLFFGLYAVFRIFAEQFREPDAALVGAITKGQFLSFFMIAFSAAFLIKACRQGRQV